LDEIYIFVIIDKVSNKMKNNNDKPIGTPNRMFVDLYENGMDDD